jgi:hypothetical protein
MFRLARVISGLQRAQTTSVVTRFISSTPSYSNQQANLASEAQITKEMSALEAALFADKKETK